jgi:CheY-like chemotaxis protein
MDDSELFLPHLPPSMTRPLLGMTVLVVEDSRYACDALRLLCLRSGARIRRADCLVSARRHLQVYRPTVIVIDLGLPDGSGLDLIAELAGAQPRIAVILGISGDDFAAGAAIAAGADGFMAKPVTSVASFQTAILSRLPADRQPSGPRPLIDENIRPDPMALQDDIAHAAEVLNEAQDGKVLDYVAQFLGGVARSAGDGDLAEAAARLAQVRRAGAPVASVTARIAGLVQDRLHGRQAI